MNGFCKICQILASLHFWGRMLILCCLLPLSPHAMANTSIKPSGSPDPELFQLWEQVYNEPARTLSDVRTQLQALQKGRDDERIAILSAIGAEAASFAEKNEEAIALAQAAETIAADLRLSWPMVHAVSTLGVIYEYDGKLDLSLKQLQRGVTLAEEAKDPELLAYALNNMGYYFGRKKETQDAIQLISRAMQAMKDLPKGILYHDILNNLASIYTRNDLVGKSDEGRKLLLTALEYFKSRNMRYMTGNIYINLGLFYRQSGQIQIASMQD